MFRSAARLLGAAGLGTVAVAGSQAVYVRTNFALPPDATGPSTGVAAPAPLTPSVPSSTQKNLVFLGDSLVTGVGCRSREGPVLPRHLAELMARSLHTPVGWSAFGETGADVGMLREKMLPQLKAEVERRKQEGQHVDMVVIMCGLNDMKVCMLHMQPWLHPHWFRQQLQRLVDEIKETAGENCAVLLPSVPLERAPRFANVWPLSTFIVGAALLWEKQKQALAASRAPSEQVAFIAQPEEILLEHFCEDGMHPNDTGYELWAAHILECFLKDRACKSGFFNALQRPS